MSLWITAVHTRSPPNTTIKRPLSRACKRALFSVQGAFSPGGKPRSFSSSLTGNQQNQSPQDRSEVTIGAARLGAALLNAPQPTAPTPHHPVRHNRSQRNAKKNGCKKDRGGEEFVHATMMQDRYRHRYRYRCIRLHQRSCCLPQRICRRTRSQSESGNDAIDGARFSSNSDGNAAKTTAITPTPTTMAPITLFL